MRESGGPDRQREVERLLDRLSRAADRLEMQWKEPGAAGPGGPASPGGPADSGARATSDLEERLKAVAAENRHLRERLAEVRERAVRLRNRLAHVEDEV